MLEFHGVASSNNESRRVSLGFVADALALDTYVEEGFGAEVSYIPGGRFQYGRLDERSKHSIFNIQACQGPSRRAFPAGWPEI